MDVQESLNNLKKHVFFELLQLAGRAFVLVRFSEDVVLGKRGFTAEEKENGIILVFNSKMNFTWDDYGITATLVFGTTPQKCFIPTDDIVAVYSSELNAQFITSFQSTASLNKKNDGSGKREENVSEKQDPGTRPQEEAVPSSNVINVDFTKKRK
ncbi:MAG: hypothetical protein ACOYW7_00645 [Nitrospirota bacterium]